MLWSAQIRRCVRLMAVEAHRCRYTAERTKHSRSRYLYRYAACNRWESQSLPQEIVASHSTGKRNYFAVFLFLFASFFLFSAALAACLSLGVRVTTCPVARRQSLSDSHLLVIHFHIEMSEVLNTLQVCFGQINKPKSKILVGL